MKRDRDLLHYECSIIIPAPASDVFAVIGDLSDTPTWAGSGHVRSITRVTDGPIGVGTRYRSSEKITMPYHADTEITVYEPDSAIEWISKPVGERVPYHHWSFRLEPAPGGTLLTHSVHAFRATGPVGWIQSVGFLFTRPKQTIPTGMEETLRCVRALATRKPPGTH
jgi:uncharacterized protein YndB with AHSA1/START domain